jgi:hypothetical protein
MAEPGGAVPPAAAYSPRASPRNPAHAALSAKLTARPAGRFPAAPQWRQPAHRLQHRGSYATETSQPADARPPCKPVPQTAPLSKPAAPCNWQPHVLDRVRGALGGVRTLCGLRGWGRLCTPRQRASTLWLRRGRPFCWAGTHSLFFCESLFFVSLRSGSALVQLD